MHNRNIRPVKHIRGMPRGSSRPQQILFSDGRQYIVKFKNNPKQGTRALVNEYIAGQLARLLNLPVPRFKIVNISKKFIRANRILTQHNFAPGHQFASEYIHNCKQNITRLLPRKLNIINRKQLTGIIVFDQWVNNIDRLKRNILLQANPREGGYKIYMIDHGHSFSYYNFSRKRDCNWTPYTLSFLPQKLKPTDFYNWCVDQVRSSGDFFWFVNKIKQLPDEQIYKVIASIPKDWNVSQVEKEALFAYLKKAKKMLPKLITQYINETHFKKHRTR
ncbi:HipA family kinase [Paenactinomyces guangxiensis]|uniref:HipA-like kinase domain-containing protein n=1 Tax=Paenactinomyces guangxiensis TaxID=1490290 RepID=A0A7W2AAD2_9BACL|nr:HipA family kinase [Paenactinomyces guangxiensis]MBA4496084.1 hypothetical protein [Paenactinomyces guangxiensis]MBH8593172.1 hypothetical protein [Paenactinomyces guangxiensis]